MFLAVGKHRPVHRSNGGRGQVLPNQPVECHEPLLGGHPTGSRSFKLPCNPFALLLRLAEARPSAPSDRLTGQSEGASMARELIEEGIGGGVVRLAGVAENPRHAGKQYEEIEVLARGRPVQVPGADHLGPQHLLETVPVQVRQGTVGQHAHTVDHAAEGRQRVVHPCQHRIHGGGVRDVGEFHFDADAPGSELLDHLLCGWVRLAAAVQHDHAGPVIGEPARHHAADAAQAAGDEIRSILA